MKTNRIESSKAPEPVGLYPHARQVGNLLFLSGVGPRERGSKKDLVEIDTTHGKIIVQLFPDLAVPGSSRAIDIVPDKCFNPVMFVVSCIIGGNICDVSSIPP